jgi:uncharacterized protein (DUF305 family)
MTVLPLCDNVGRSKPEHSTPMKSCLSEWKRKLRTANEVACLRSGPGIVAAALALSGFFSLPVFAQQSAPSSPVVVQPGAPGKPTRTLPPSTRGTLPPSSPADVEFMQDMIMHHAQAVEMTALIASHTENKNLRSLGARISHSQADEIKFMKRWLTARGEPTSMAMPEMADMPGMDMPHHAMPMPGLMPGMLTPEQMEALRKAKGEEFDHLFLTGMVQHHNGALVMVKELFDTAGAGQDAELFNFATDVDSGQRAEIRIMQTMLGEKPLEEKR